MFGDIIAYKRPQLTPEEEIGRTKRPEPGQIYALVEMMLGSDKLRVQCEDGKERMARIPGKLRKRVWIRVGDLILVEPWKVQSDERCDVKWRYTPTQAEWIRRKGFLKNI
ncbi:MAG: translation initiation factor eIF-1A [Candidatus Aenigmarchaeota archaeon CG_4_10_14_0_8_um_filter_37_24]|nr:translation initiation factor eIF-1A [Candidatus Aenigmarchaeota archaeon]PIV69249.1 MAG: translation initiation factor eIF-1A [Candidatus Aenigmarchaeota archaeon CG01_land_8_20_14_3_00_37_9]PIW41507.1 MAG: translation initiation factor eIF-1A [Candidatus Aenigmarchaeota archaeon CG15_BIG_FIL_POST_REV_8_21_14_020_37_27]PIX51051.1 MAG: translation initiation factor eIF-1A [Candidatus Aenigmarchaeota archaeon CG_4_8_14_3_um_filter_37_24]PIY35860.1 MAG: translation initiation factor eIF-1A [Ca